jgi:trimeric autotransporter adhesin
MNIRYRSIISFILLNLLFALPALAQHSDGDDKDCDFNERANIIRSKQQYVADSLEYLSFNPATVTKPEPCAVPAFTTVDLTFNVKEDRIYGFFNGVKNANVYLVLLSETDVPAFPPVNGVRYRNGDFIGKSRVIANSDATAFAAMDLKSATAYRIDIYTGNDNCNQGIKYNTAPVFSGQKTTSATNDLHYYYGNLHSHSGYSDGNKEDVSVTPSQDYAFAKDALCMDFLGIADHNHFSYPGNPGMLLANYHLGLQQTNTFNNNNPDFLALYGMEYGVINNGGHVVVYGIDSLLGWETINGSPNYDIYIGKFDYSGSNGLFSTINRFKASKAFATLAHPEDNDYGNLLNTALRPIVDSALVGSALENGPAFTDEVNYQDYPSKLSYLSYYKGLLARGYHVGPTMDHDNHYLTFGRTARSRLVVLSHSLDKSDFMDAMRSRSFYVSHSCTAMLDFNVSGETMGTVMEHAYEPAFVVSIEDVSSSQTPGIKIYKGINDGSTATIIATGSGNALTYTDNNLADGASAYYFTDVSIGSSRTISSPVWYHRNDHMTNAINPVSSIKQSSQIDILENPVKGQILQYQLKDGNDGIKGTVIITDIYGRQIFSESIVMNDRVRSIILSAFPAGTYLLQVNSAKGRYHAKFVKY